MLEFSGVEDGRRRRDGFTRVSTCIVLVQSPKGLAQTYGDFVSRDRQIFEEFGREIFPYLVDFEIKIVEEILAKIERKMHAKMKSCLDGINKWMLYGFRKFFLERIIITNYLD